MENETNLVEVTSATDERAEGQSLWGDTLVVTLVDESYLEYSNRFSVEVNGVHYTSDLRAPRANPELSPSDAMEAAFAFWSSEPGNERV